MKLLVALACLVMAGAGWAQPAHELLSKPVDISLRGWNRVLLMRSGSTLLFHFEPSHLISVIAFDSAGKATATQDDHYRVLDRFSLVKPDIKGLFELNGEAVLFLDQELMTKHCLIRLRYSAASGRLIEEKLVAESKNANKRMEFYVMKNRHEDNYAIFFCTDLSHPRESDLYVVYFDELHNSSREVQLELDRKKFDFLKVLGAEADPKGILITLGLDKTKLYARPDHNSPIVEGGAVYDHFIKYFYLAKDSSGPATCMIDVSESVYPSIAWYTGNASVKGLNSVVHNSHAITYKYGLDNVSAEITSTLFVKIDEASMAAKFRTIKNSIANQFLKTQTDTSRYYTGIPVRMATEAHGITTLISRGVTEHQDQQSLSRYDASYTSTLAGITQLDEQGRELWGVVLPCNQAYQQMPLNSYSYHFNNLVTCRKGTDFFVIFNDYDENFNNSLRTPGYIINSFENTNAFCYKIDGSRQVTRQYVFGTPAKKEYRSCFTDAASFDEETGVYAALISYKKRGKVSIRMAWSQLSP